jgi:hypothetical protein
MPAFPGLERGIPGDLKGPRLSCASSKPIGVGWSVSCAAPAAGAVRLAVVTPPTLVAARDRESRIRLCRDGSVRLGDGGAAES